MWLPSQDVHNAVSERRTLSAGIVFKSQRVKVLIREICFVDLFQEYCLLSFFIIYRFQSKPWLNVIHILYSNNFDKGRMKEKLYNIMLFKEFFISFYVINYKGSHSCGSTTATVTGDKAPLDPDVTNPCTTQALASNEYFFAYSKDHTKFIHCDVWLNAWVTSCPPSLVWNQQSHACIADQHHEASNPCTQEQLDNGITMFPHPDPHKYIHCDSGLNQWVQSCVGGTVFDFASQTCVWENVLVGWLEQLLFVLMSL